MNRPNSQFRKALLLASSAAAISWAAPALAQDTPTQVASADDAVVDELLVTARRREENLQDVPIAVSALSAQRLENIDATDITTLQYTTPNSTVQVARGSNSTLIAFIRGVGQQDPLWGFDPGVGLYVDDIYVARPQAAVLDIYDVERIEVLRGPQGTLYGRNTIGGAIKYVTRSIGQDPQLHLKGEYGSYNQRDWFISAKTPLGDKFGIGVSVARFLRDGYGENLTTGAEHYDKNIWAARGTIEAMPTENLFFRLSADIVHDDSNPRHGHREIPVAGLGGDVLPDVFDTRAGIGDVNEVEARGVSFLGQWEATENLTFKSITAYRAGETQTVIDFDNTPRPILDIPARYADHQFTQEFQALYTGDRIQGVAGIYYLNATASGAFDTILGNLGVNIATSGFVDTRSWAAFADVNYDITDQLSVDVGLRYTHDTKKGSVTRSTYLGAFLSPVLGGPARNPIVFNTPTYVNERDFEALTPRASVSFKFNPELTGYASYNRGFKSGGFDMRGDARLYPATVNGYNPEYVDSFEVGLKGSLMDGRVNFATDVFYALYEDVQVTTQYPSALGIASVVDNVGKATFYGWEFEGSARFTDNFRADVAIGYIHGQYDEFLAFVPGAPGNGQACAANPPSPPNAAGCFVDLSGVRDIQNTPDWTGSFSFTWTADVANGKLAFTPLLAYRGSFQMFEAASPLDQEGYWLLDANLSWTDPSGRFVVGLHGKNLFDETYRTGGYFFPGAAVFGDSITAFYGPPRTVSVSLDVRL